MNYEKDPAAFKTTRAELLTLLTAVAAIVLWIVNTFQSKSEAAEFRQNVDSRVAAMEENNLVRFRRLYDKLEEVAGNVHYIKGKLERDKH